VADLARRAVLAGLAGAVVAATGLGRQLVTEPADGHTGVPRASADPAPPDPGAPNPVRPPPPPRVALPGGGVLSALPDGGDRFALTLDDGVNPDVVRMYTEFARDSGLRLTYFVNGVYDSWTQHRGLLAPLVASGQIQLGNHTWSHPDLTTVSTDRIASEITRNERFIADTYGVNPRPYLRPPYGKHDSSVRAVAADLGYPAITLWNGSLADSTVITEDYIVSMADQYFRPHNVVIGHLNHVPVTHVYDKLLATIHGRGLRTVTLDDVFTKPA
jgi:peptidoglycan-N-acetylglucosamine deacetylase